MKSQSSKGQGTFFQPAGRSAARNVFLAIVLCFAGAGGLSAQQPASPAADPITVQLLLKKMEQLELRDAQLEARIEQLEAGGQRAAPAQPPGPPSAPPEAIPAPAPGNSETAAVPADLSSGQGGQPDETLLRIRGFGDFGFHGSNKKADVTSFSLGQLDLFITSDISDKFKFLTELVFEVHSNNEFEEDLERVLLKYSYNDHLNLAFGRYHTAIGYYNTAYHHSTWYQTTTDRPFIFQYEDEGGILPVHSVGVSATGLIPSGRLGLHYVAEVGNGRASRSPLDQPVQNGFDENTHKDFNLALYAKPEKIPGLQVGFSTYRDVLFPEGKGKVGETIMDGYAVLSRANFEWLNEALLIRHSEQAISRTFNTPGFYSQISRRFGSYRPYFQYQYVNAPENEPMFPEVGLRHGPSLGMRYEASESVAVKLQYDYTSLRRQAAVQALGLQLSFAF